MSTKITENIPKEQSGDEPDDVLFHSIYGVRTIELNRPRKLNSLNGSMARKIIPRLKVGVFPYSAIVHITLSSYPTTNIPNPFYCPNIIPYGPTISANRVPLQEWQKSQLASIVIISGAGPKAFCAGGDVAALAQLNTQGPSGQAKSRAYFGLEYQLDHLIASYSKPYIAYMDGITMGGGVGLSVHAPIRIATERTLFAMPETTIGFFPDVGASFFMPRLDGEVGTYLALTSERLKGVQSYYAGVATHYIDSSSLESLTARLSELVFKDNADKGERLAIIDATIEEFSTGLPYDEPMLIAGTLREAIDRCFGHNTIEEIIAALEREEGETEDWARNTLKTLKERSPTSLKVALKQMRVSGNWDIAETFQREYCIASKFMEHPDFVEGVTAKLISKPPKTPKWNPARLEDVPTSAVDQFFMVEGSERLALLEEGEYREYPHGYLGLPTERQIEGRVKEEDGAAWEAVMETFVGQRSGKPGIKEKVAEVLERRCRIDSHGRVFWQTTENRGY